MFHTYSNELYYKELNYPQLKEDILAAGILKLSDEERISHENRINPGRRDLVQTGNGTIRTAWHKSKNIVNASLINHIIETLQPEFTDLEDIGIKQQWIWGSSTITAHVDHGRGPFYMYILDLGGDEVETSFYTEPNKPLYRKWEPALSKLEDTRSLIKIHTTVFKPNTWYYFNPNIIHDVSNLASCRTAICVTKGTWSN